MPEYLSAYITAASEEEARRLAEKLLDARLIACANISGPVTSLYRWEGVRQEAKEWVVIAKTRAARQQEIMDMVKAQHSYDCPCMLFYPVSGGFLPFLQWVAVETDAEKEH